MLITLTPEDRFQLEQKYAPEHIDAYLALSDETRTSEHAACRGALTSMDPDARTQLWMDLCDLDPAEQLRKKLGDDLCDFLDLLDGSELTVFQLCAESGKSQPTVSRWLNTLKAHDLVDEIPPVRLPARWKRKRE